MMVAFTALENYFSKFHLLDWAALALYLTELIGYRFFLKFMLRHRPENLFLGKLQQYRNAWIESHTGGQNAIVVVQSMRNTIMSASFLASTSVILIMGALNMLRPFVARGEPMTGLSGASEPAVESFKILLIVIILSYSFFNFTWHIREINYMSFILNIPKEELDRIEGGDSVPRMSQMFLTSGIYFSLGIRAYYFLVPLLMWFFSPALMIVSSVAILIVLLRRDIAG